EVIKLGPIFVVQPVGELESCCLDRVWFLLNDDRRLGRISPAAADDNNDDENQCASAGAQHDSTSGIGDPDGRHESTPSAAETQATDFFRNGQTQKSEVSRPITSAWFHQETRPRSVP